MAEFLKWAVEPNGNTIMEWRKDYNKMASLIFDLVKTEGDEPCVERCCDGHIKESKSLHLLLVANATKKSPPQEAFELTSDRRKWETNEKASMEIVKLLDMFNDLISNKESV